MVSLESLLAISTFCSHPATLAVFSLLLFVLFIYWLGTYQFAVLKDIDVPGPKPWPFVGNIPEVQKCGGLHLLQLKFLQKYGKVFTMCFGRKPSLMIADPEIVKEIAVKEFSSFRNRPVTPVEAPPPLEKNLVSARDEQWKRIRNILTPSFSGAKMKQMVPLMEKSTETLKTKFGEVAHTGKAVDIHSWFSQFTLDVILSTVFGFESDVQTNPDDKFFKEAKNVFKHHRLFNFLRTVPFVSLLNYLPINKRSYPVDIASEIVCKRRQQGLVGRKDLLHAMFTAQEENTATGISKLTNDEIIAQAVVFLLAGFETTNSTLTSIVYNLVLNPDIQEKLYSEITATMAANPGMPLYDLIHNIEYLQCVINEAQRLIPPGYMPLRECSQSCNINGLKIPAGMEVIFAIYALHHDPEAWSDPEKFDPERFCSPAKDTRHPYQFIPFGAGPRNCIGMRLALVEMKIILVKTLLSFKFVRCPETQVPMALIAGATLHPRDGLFVRVESRE